MMRDCPRNDTLQRLKEDTLASALIPDDIDHLGYDAKVVPGDGNCLYNCVSIYVTGNLDPYVTQNIEIYHDTISVCHCRYLIDFKRFTLGLYMQWLEHPHPQPPSFWRPIFKNENRPKTVDLALK
jgi:hypothetical protein